jgi:hypothetical protein
MECRESKAKDSNSNLDKLINPVNRVAFNRVLNKLNKGRLIGSNLEVFCV